METLMELLPKRKQLNQALNFVVICLYHTQEVYTKNATRLFNKIIFVKIITLAVNLGTHVDIKTK